MVKMLDFGTQIDKDDDPYEDIRRMESLIPENHQYLFDMIQNMTEYTSTENIMTDYINGKIGKTSLFLCLQNLHPYFRIFPDAACAVLNRSLADSINKMPLSAKERQLMFDRFLFQRHPYMDTDFHTWVADNGSGTLEDVEDTVRNAAYYVSFIMDDSNVQMAALSPAARASMYAIVSTDTDESGRPLALDIPVRITLPESDGVRGAAAALDFDENRQAQAFDGIKDILSGKPLPPVWKQIASQDNGMLEDMTLFYQIENFQQLIRLELYLMTEDGIRVNRCKTCGRLFPILETGQEYCDFGVHSHLAAHKDAQRKRQLQKLMTKNVKTHRSRVRKGIETEEEYRMWYNQAKALQGQAEEDKTDPGKFENEITKIDPHKELKSLPKRGRTA